MSAIWGKSGNGVYLPSCRSLTPAGTWRLKTLAAQKDCFVSSVKRNIAPLHGHVPPRPDLRGYVGGWRGIPAKIQNRISTDVQAITSDPAFRSRMATAGSDARSGTPAASVTELARLS